MRFPWVSVGDFPSRLKRLDICLMFELRYGNEQWQHTFSILANCSTLTCLSLFQLAPQTVNCLTPVNSISHGIAGSMVLSIWLDSRNILILPLILFSYTLSTTTIYKEQYLCSFWTTLDPNFLFSSLSGFRFLWLTCNTGFLAPIQPFGKLQTDGFATASSQATADCSSCSNCKDKISDIIPQIILVPHQTLHNVYTGNALPAQDQRSKPLKIRWY
jgi:hypothetical protein